MQKKIDKISTLLSGTFEGFISILFLFSAIGMLKIPYADKELPKKNQNHEWVKRFYK